MSLASFSYIVYDIVANFVSVDHRPLLVSDVSILRLPLSNGHLSLECISLNFRLFFLEHYLVSLCITVKLRVPLLLLEIYLRL